MMKVFLTTELRHWHKLFSNITDLQENEDSAEFIVGGVSELENFQNRNFIGIVTKKFDINYLKDNLGVEIKFEELEYNNQSILIVGRFELRPNDTPYPKEPLKEAIILRKNHVYSTILFSEIFRAYYKDYISQLLLEILEFAENNIEIIYPNFSKKEWSSIVTAINYLKAYGKPYDLSQFYKIAEIQNSSEPWLKFFIEQGLFIIDENEDKITLSSNAEELITKYKNSWADFKINYVGKGD